MSMSTPLSTVSQWIMFFKEYSPNYSCAEFVKCIKKKKKKTLCLFSVSNCTKVCVIYKTVRLGRYLGSTPTLVPLSRINSAGIRKAFNFFHSFCWKPGCHNLWSLIFCWSLLSILCSTLATSWSFHLSSVFIWKSKIAKILEKKIHKKPPPYPPS